MKRHGPILILAAAMVAALFLQCVNKPVAGGSSDTEISARISGVALDGDGNAIANGQVRLRLRLPQPALHMQSSLRPKGKA